MFWRIAGVAALIVAAASPALSQPYVYTLVHTNPIREDMYQLARPYRLASIDTATGQVTTAKLPESNYCPEAIVDPSGSRIYVECGSLYALDSATLRVIGTAPIDGNESIAISADGTKIVTTSSSGADVVSTSPLSRLAHIPLNSPPGPVAVAPDGTRAYVLDAALTYSVAVLDLEAAKVVQKIVLPSGYPSALSLSGDGRTLVVGMSGKLCLIDTASLAITGTVDLNSTGAIGRQLAVDNSGSRAWVPIYSPSDADGVAVVDLASRQVVERFPIDGAYAVALLSSTRAAVVQITFSSNYSSSYYKVSTVDLTDGTVLASTSTLDGAVDLLSVGGTSGGPLTVAEPCTYNVEQLYWSYMNSAQQGRADGISGGTQWLGITAEPLSCAWTAATDVSWLTLDQTSGTGSTIVRLTIAANNTGAPRTGHVTSMGVTYTVTQIGCVNPVVVIDTPLPNASVKQPYQVAGWALDTCALSGTGLMTGSGYGVPRPDVAAVYGSQFMNSGFSFLDNTEESAAGPKTVTVTLVSPFGWTATASVTVNVLPSSPPFGNLETPASGAIVSGELPVTGWALDDVKLTKVKIYRTGLTGEAVDATGRVFVGDAIRVTGARPDVQAAFPSTPENDKAGFGLMVLTNMLPNGGNGMFVFSADAIDGLGQVTTLGPKIVTASNASSKLPFGTIDTPTQGQTVSGTIVNFGWALAPAPNVIPADGSTIDIVIDGAVVGHPVYDQCRADIATLFPGYANADGAVGYYYLDTTTLANGVHTISWVVRDGAGNASGIGSRYFTVQNTAAVASGTR